jgi:hypothetical protein
MFCLNYASIFVVLVHFVGDSPKGPLKQRGNPHLKPSTKPKNAKPNHAGA